MIFYIFPGTYIGKFWRRISEVLKMKISRKTEKAKNTLRRYFHSFVEIIRQHKVKKSKSGHNKNLKKNIFLKQKKD